MKITEQELALRKDRIIEEAFRLFCLRGIEKVSLSDIARQAVVSESSLYRYFGSKPALVYSTLGILWKKIGGHIRDKVDQTAGYNDMTGLEQIAVQMESCRQLYETNGDYVLFSYETKLYLLRNKYHLSAEEYDSLMLDIREHFVASLEKGRADGSIPSDKEPVDLFYAVWGSLRGYIVKIVIYSALCQEESPWESRYRTVENGILSALASGWKECVPKEFNA